MHEQPLVGDLGGGGEVLGESSQFFVVGEMAPPPPVVMTLLPLKLSAETLPQLPVWRPL